MSLSLTSASIRMIDIDPESYFSLRYRSRQASPAGDAGATTPLGRQVPVQEGFEHTLFAISPISAPGFLLARSRLVDRHPLPGSLELQRVGHATEMTRSTRYGLGFRGELGWLVLRRGRVFSCLLSSDQQHFLAFVARDPAFKPRQSVSLFQTRMIH